MNQRMSMPSEEDLSAFIDGELDENRRHEVEAAVALNADLAAEMARLRLQGESLRRMAAPILDEAVPEGLQRIVGSPRIEAMPNRGSRDHGWFRARFLWQAGALAATLCLGVFIGWRADSVFNDKRAILDPFVEQAVLSHRLFESNKQFDSVEKDSDVITIDIGDRPFTLPARTPTLKGSDYVPVMVRQDQGEPGNAIHVAYENRDGDWTTLFIRPHSSEARLPAKFGQEEGYAVLYWLDGPLVYALVGKGDEDELRDLAQKIYQSPAASEIAPLPQEEAPAEVRPVTAQ